MAAQAPLTTRLDGKVALITGSSRGMERQHALELAQRSSDIINYSSSPAPEDAAVRTILSMGRQAIAIKADVIVVSNSGVESFGHISEITLEEIDRVLSINTKGQLLVAPQAYTYLTAGGRLVLLSPISAQAKSILKPSLYSESKGAGEAFVRCLAQDFGDEKITVNAFAPGDIKTDMYAEAARLYITGSDDWSDEKLEQAIAG